MQEKSRQERCRKELCHVIVGKSLLYFHGAFEPFVGFGNNVITLKNSNKAMTC